MVVLLCFVSTASPVVINEVMANPKGYESGAGSPGDRNEFVELYNLSDDTVDLLNWRLTDLDALDYLKAWADPGLLTRYPGVVIGSTRLPPGGFALILDPEYTSTDTVGGYYQPYEIPDSTLILTIGNTTLGNGLQNNDPLILYDPDSAFISCFGTPDDPEDGFPSDAGDGCSWERVRPELVDSVASWAISLNPGGATPGKENSTLTWHDLAVLSLELGPGIRGMEVQVWVENRAYNPAQDWQLWLSDDGDTVGMIPGPLLSARDSVRLDWSGPKLEPGDHIISAWVDYPEDCDPANNRAARPFSAYGASRYLMVTPNPFSPDDDGIDDRARIRYWLPEPGGRLTISVYDRRGRLIKRLLDVTSQTAQGEVEWDGMKADGVLAPLGIYLIRLEYRCGKRSHSELSSMVLAKRL